jgi:predicted ATPase
MAHPTRKGGVQFVIATRSPIILTFPGAVLLSFDDGQIQPVTLVEWANGP